MLDAKRIQPSWWYSLLTIPCLFVGIGLFVWFLRSGIRQSLGAVTQVIVPNTTVLNIKRTGVYTIFLEQPSVVNGTIYSNTAPVRDLTCRLTQQLPSQTSEESPQSEVALRKPSLNLSYSLGNRSGRAVLEFEADALAFYRLSCGYPDARTQPQVVRAVGTGIGTKILKTLIQSLFGLLSGTGLGTIVIIAISSRRERFRRGMLGQSTGYTSATILSK